MAASELIGVDPGPLRVVVQHFAPECAARIVIGVVPGARRLSARVRIAEPGARERIRYLLEDGLGLTIDPPVCRGVVELEVAIDATGVAEVCAEWHDRAWRWEGQCTDLAAHPPDGLELPSALAPVVSRLGSPARAWVGPEMLVLVWRQLPPPDVIRVITTLSPGTAVGGLLGATMRTVEPALDRVARFELRWSEGRAHFGIGVESGALPAVGEA